MAYALSDIFSWPFSNSFNCASLKVSRLPSVLQSLETSVDRHSNTSSVGVLPH